MKLERGKVSGKWHIRFDDEYAAQRWEWIFVKLLRMHYCCANGFSNAFTWH